MVHKLTAERWTQRVRPHSLRYRVTLVDSYGSIVAPGAQIIETRYRGASATWNVARLGDYPTTVGGHYDPVVHPGESEHDPATCPECLAAAAEEAAAS
jgi:hypothetical protein